MLSELGGAGVLIGVVATLAATLIGAAMSLLGGWLAVRWQSGKSAEALARSILAEIEAALDLDEHGQTQQLFRDTFANLKETGEIENRAALLALIDIPQREVSPVYHASLPNLGHLPPDLARELVAFNAAQAGLLHVGVRFLGHDVGLNENALRGLGYSLEQQYDALLDRRDALRKNLRTFLGIPPPDPVLRLTATLPAAGATP